MDQCSRHATPPAVSVLLTDQQGHDLTLGLHVRGTTVVTRWRLGDSFAPTESSAVDPH
jgi:hypothetical protein